MKRSRSLWAVAVLLLWCPALSQNAGAVTVKWAGGDGKWLDATKWDFAVGGAPTGHAPLPAEDVVIDAGPKIDLSPLVPPTPDVPVAKSLLLQGVGTTSFTKSLLTVSGDVMIDTSAVSVHDGAKIGGGAPLGDLFIDNAGYLGVGEPLVGPGGRVERRNLDLIAGTANRVEVNGDGKIELMGDTTIGVQGKITINAGHNPDPAAINAELPGSTGNLYVAQHVGTTELFLNRGGSALFGGTATIDGDVHIQRGGLFRTKTAVLNGTGRVWIYGMFAGPPIQPSTWTVGTGGLTVFGNVDVTSEGFLDVRGDLLIRENPGPTESKVEIDGGTGSVIGNLSIERSSSFDLKTGNTVVDGNMTVGTPTEKGGAFRLGNSTSNVAKLDVQGTVTVDARSLDFINRIDPNGILETTTFDFNDGLLIGRGFIAADVFSDAEIYVGSSNDATKDTLHVVGDYTQELGGDLHMVLAGNDFSMTDQLKVNLITGASPGAASLSGDLILHVDSSLNVQAGDFIDLVMSKGTLTGTFDRVLFEETGGFPGGLTPTSLGKPYEIQYIRSDANDIQRVRLKIIPEPGTGLLLIAGVILGVSRRFS